MKRDAVMGIDASLTHTGVSIVCVDDGTHIERMFAPKTKAVERLIDIEHWFNELMLELNDPACLIPKYIVMEGYAYTPRFGQAFSLGELGGILKRFFYRAEIPLYTVQPQTLKKWITGIGKGDKNMMLLKAFKKWGIEFSDDHTCDAFGLATIGKALYDIRNGKAFIKGYLQYEQEVIKLIMKQLKK
jgi:Holliday junction resolvasome RuvABC endonuclease subunit